MVTYELWYVNTLSRNTNTYKCVTRVYELRNKIIIFLYGFIDNEYILRFSKLVGVPFF